MNNQKEMRMKFMPISLVLAMHIIGFFGTIKTETPQPKSIKQLSKERDLGALSWRFKNNIPNIDEASIDNQTPLVVACKNLDNEMVGFLLNDIQNANPNLSNPLGVTLRAILDLHNRTKPSETPPTTTEIPEFPQAASIEEILDTLIKSGANPLIHKLENLQLLDALIRAREKIAFSADRNPIFIALRKILPLFLVYEASEPIDKPQRKGMTKDGDTKNIDMYLQSIKNLYEKFPRTFDPLNTTLIDKGKDILGKTPIQLAAENGRADGLQAMLDLKDQEGHTRVSFVTAHTALRSAESKKAGIVKSCKEILEEFLRTHFIFNKTYSKHIIQTAQSIVAHTTWQQKDTKPGRYDSAITNAISKYTEKRLTSN
jgi:hypothetical protein